MSKIITFKEQNNNDIHQFTEESTFLQEIDKIYSQGGLFVYPTETLYGLGANPYDEKALDRLYSVKKRPKDMAISVAVSNIGMMERLGEVNEIVKEIAEHFLPGPITLLLKNKGQFSQNVASKGKLGIRIPDHKIALKIIETVGPITATSANLHNGLDPKNVKIAYEQLGDDVDLYIDCGVPRYKGPSTIVDCTGVSINIIRKGVIPEKEIIALFE
jgi:L-threonylcarbamoyladenylate synthase